MTTELFKVGSVDYTSHIVAGTYDVNSVKQYAEWTDGFGALHRDQRPAKIVGSFDMVFKNATDYTQFLVDLEAAKYNAEYQYNIFVRPNNVVSAASSNIHAFVDFLPVRDVTGTMQDRYKEFTVEIKES